MGEVVRIPIRRSDIEATEREANNVMLTPAYQARIRELLVDRRPGQLNAMRVLMALVELLKPHDPEVRFPSQAALAKALGIQPQQVGQALDYLEEEDMIVTLPGARPTDTRRVFLDPDHVIVIDSGVDVAAQRAVFELAKRERWRSAAVAFLRQE
jgi:hypothetical protein